MTRNFLWLLLFSSVFSNSYGTTQTEKKLLASWGVVQNQMGMIEYKNKKVIKPIHWMIQSMPDATLIDYSLMPFNLKPLVIYNN